LQYGLKSVLNKPEKVEGGGTSGFSLLIYTGRTTLAGVQDGDPRVICKDVVKLWIMLDLSTKIFK